LFATVCIKDNRTLVITPRSETGPFFAERLKNNYAVAEATGIGHAVALRTTRRRYHRGSTRTQEGWQIWSLDVSAATAI